MRMKKLFAVVLTLVMVAFIGDTGNNEMGIFSKLFGANNEEKAEENLPPEQDPNLIKAYDEYGREIFISKEDWRKNVLPGALQKAWNNPDELYNTIVTALQDEFYSDVLPASQQLLKIDRDQERVHKLSASAHS